MRQFSCEKLAEASWDNEIVSYAAQIHEHKGRQELYLRKPQVQLDRLMQNAKIESTEASNRIEGITTAEARLRPLLCGRSAPQSRDEEEILGYYDVLNLVQENWSMIPLQPNWLLQMHRDMLRHTSLPYGGRFKTAPNEIDAVLPDGTRTAVFIPLSPYETPDAIAAICKNFAQELDRGRISPLLLIPCFVLDFLCIHPFTDGNGRMSRLLTLLLLCQSGCMVGKYISIEKAIADTKEAYYSALVKSDRGWLEGKNDPLPFIKYMLGIILWCCREFEARMTRADRAGAKSTACDVVKLSALERLGLFSRQDALAACPSLGSSLSRSCPEKADGRRNPA